MRRVNNRKHYLYFSAILMSLLITPFLSLHSLVSSENLILQNKINIHNFSYNSLLKDNINKVDAFVEDPIKNYFLPVESLLESSLHESGLNKDDFKNWWLEAIGADKINPLYNGTGVKVAILDTGVYDHPDLNIIANKKFAAKEDNYNDEYGHGTHCAGIVGSSGDGSSGEYRGIAPGVSIINAKIGGLKGGFTESGIIEAINWSVEQGADIISMSFGVPDPNGNIAAALTFAVSKNVTCIASAGNSGPEYYTGSFPAYGVNVISVGATDKTDSLASFTSIGPSYTYLGYPDVVAPGVDIISTSAHNSFLEYYNAYVGDIFDFSGASDYIPLSGTSMSGPMVAGACAILKSKYPSLTPEAIRIALLEGAERLTNEKEDDILKSGAGLINVSASLQFLDGLTNVNNISKIFPDSLPIKPYDLLNFPGDHQRFNLTVISGIKNTYDINIPAIDGVSLSLDNEKLIYQDSGVNFTSLDVIIESNARPGPRNFEINITANGVIYDSINVSFEVKLPEHKILLESYHGLNDWLLMASNYDTYNSNLTSPYYQMGFYEAMKDISEKNISIDYNMEFWTPDYDKNKNNSILTEERLFQYDLIVLQNPILPYSQTEILALQNYFNSGGNILLLGTRYQALCRESLNHLLSALNTDIEVKDDNIMLINYEGAFYESYYYQVTDLDGTSPIFQGISKFFWKYGSTFDISGEANSLASIGEKTVVAEYDGDLDGRGRVVAFGDLNWLYYDYQRSGYESSHSALLSNLMDYFLSNPENDFSINIGLDSERISQSQLNITMYVKNQTSEQPLDKGILNSENLTLSISNGTETYEINLTSDIDGIAINHTLDLSDYFLPNPNPIDININLTIGTKIYSKTSKVIWVDNSEVPEVIDLSFNDTDYRRGNLLSINSTLNLVDCTVNGYMVIFTNSIHNTKETSNRTLSFLSYNDEYSALTIISDTDPTGYGFAYIDPISENNFSNPFSPRIYCRINNYDPEIVESSSYVSFGGYTLKFEDTHNETEETIFILPTAQGDLIDFDITINDNENDNIRVYANFLVGAVSYGTFSVISPRIINYEQFSYVSGSYSGTYTIPYTLNYDSLTGTKDISTASNLVNGFGYIGLILITVIDSEGGITQFYLLFTVDPTYNYDWVIFLIIIVAISIIVGVLILLYIKRKMTRKQTSRNQYSQPYYGPSLQEDYEEGSDYYSKQGDASQPNIIQGGGTFCPHCGKFIDVPKKFCPHCGMSIVKE